jgi:hypothetical protein
MVATAEKNLQENVLMRGNGSEDSANKRQGLANQS